MEQRKYLYNSDYPAGSQTRQYSLTTKIMLAWCIAFFTLAIAGWAGQYAVKIGGGQVARQGIQALLMTGMVVAGISWLRLRLDKGTPESIGTGKLRDTLNKLMMGMGLVIVPVIITLAFIGKFGWGELQFNATPEILLTAFTGIGAVFFFEALPEELVFRGYIYSNLNTKFSRWKSAVLAVLLFAAVPLLLLPVQQYVLGMNIQLGNASRIEISYVITMLFFGAFVQYLRIITGSIWTGIGFHLVFVYSNHLIGQKPTSLFQLTNISNEQPIQFTFVGVLLLIFILLLLYPRLTKNRDALNSKTTIKKSGL